MLEHSQIVKAIAFICPDAGFAVNDSEIVNWESEEPQPTMAEIEAGWIAYQAKLEADLAAEQAKKEAAEAKLVALGLTSDDLKALGL